MTRTATAAKPPYSCANCGDPLHSGRDLHACRACRALFCATCFRTDDLCAACDTAADDVNAGGPSETNGAGSTGRKAAPASSEDDGAGSGSLEGNQLEHPFPASSKQVDHGAFAEEPETFWAEREERAVRLDYRDASPAQRADGRVEGPKR